MDTIVEYHKMGKHRKQCMYCNKLIQDGERVVMRVVTKERWYPVKGIMKFTTYKFRHIGCNV